MPTRPKNFNRVVLKNFSRHFVQFSFVYCYTNRLWFQFPVWNVWQWFVMIARLRHGVKVMSASLLCWQTVQCFWKIIKNILKMSVCNFNCLSISELNGHVCNSILGHLKVDPNYIQNLELGAWTKKYRIFPKKPDDQCLCRHSKDLGRFSQNRF